MTAPSIREALKHALASLVAAISLLERTPRAKKAAPSDKMFDQMIADYKAAIEQGRAALAALPQDVGEGIARNIEPEAVTVEELARAIEWYAASPFNRSKAAAEYILSRFDVRRR